MQDKALLADASTGFMEEGAGRKGPLAALLQAAQSWPTHAQMSQVGRQPSSSQQRLAPQRCSCGAWTASRPAAAQLRFPANPAPGRQSQQLDPACSHQQPRLAPAGL
jgi:hypothetical protein